MKDKLDIENIQNTYKKILILIIIIIIGYIAIVFSSFALPKIYEIDEDTIIDTNGDVKNGINILRRGKVRLTISGWAYKTGQPVKTFNSHFVLKNRETNKMYILKTSMCIIEQLEDVDGLFDCSKCGLDSQTLTVVYENGIYDLYILYENDDENLLVDTGVNVEI